MLSFRLFIFLILPCLYGYGQNLVENPSFEFGDVCKSQSANSSLPNDFGWWELNYGSSVDIYSECNGTVPKSHGGMEYAEHGKVFVGCVLKDKYIGLSRYRENAQSQLKSPLTKGRRYLVSFYCSNMEGYSVEIKNVDVGFTRKMGKHKLFSFDRRKVINPFNEGNFDYPRMNGWTHKSVVYAAKGTENYIVLGNFSSCFRLKKKRQSDSKFGTLNRAYYLYDDISVIEVPKNYIETRLDSTVLYSDYKVVNQPSVGDTITIPGLSFRMNDKSLSDEFDELLKSMSDYLLINPFLVINLSFNEETDYKGKRRDRLFSDREENLTLRFEELGVSSNRIHYNWRDIGTDKAGFFIIHDNIDGEVLKMYGN